MHYVAAYQFVHLLTMTKDLVGFSWNLVMEFTIKNLVIKQEFREILSDSRSTEGRQWMSTRIF